MTAAPPADRPLVDAVGLAWRSPDSFELHVHGLSLRRGQRLALVGPSGSGKSTLLGLLSMGLRPGAGSLRILGQDAWAATTSDAARTALRARAIGFVPQTAALLNFLPVRENIALPINIAGAEGGHRRAGELLDRLGLSPLLHRLPETLSVGQRQRVAIARALIARPPIVLADEPTSALHPDQARDVMRLLAEAPPAEAAVLIVTHDLDTAARAGFSLLPVRTVGSATHVGSRPVCDDHAPTPDATLHA